MTPVVLRWPLRAYAWVLVALALGAVAAGWTGWAGRAAAAARRTPTLSPTDAVIDGPTSDIAHLDAMSVARDGTGGLVYVKNIAGVAHVFVSRLLGGTFQAPQQIDAGLGTASSQPVIAAGQGGLLLVAFVNSGTLYVAQAGDVASAIATPAPLVSGAINPSLSMSTFGKAYLAFTDVSGAVDHVRTAFYYKGQWALEYAPLNADPSQSAGTDTGRPRVVACGDGIGIVVWGEDGHIYTRRVSGTSPSVDFQQADTPLIDGASEVSTSNPMIASGGDSSYASVTFQADVSSGPSKYARVVMDRLHAGAYDGIFRADGLSAGGPEGADQPQTAVTEFGTGWVTSEHTQTHQLWAGLEGGNEAGQSVQRVDSSPNAAAPDAVPAVAGVTSTLIAWQQTPGISGPAEIRVRYAPQGFDLGPEQVVSSPTLGATAADSGLVAAGDVAGDAAIAWVQGTGSGQQIVAGQLYQSPGSFAPLYTSGYATSADPVLSWSTSAESWGPVQYAIEFDGAAIGTTYGTQIATPAPVADGPHTWAVTATNQAGLSTAARTATVFVDTVSPHVTIKLTGRRVVKLAQRIAVADSDPPPPGAPASVASGIGSAQLKWGDGTQVKVGRSATHAYRRAGTYTLTVTVTDRAGNTALATHRLTIRPKPTKPRRAPATRSRPGHPRQREHR